METVNCNSYEELSKKAKEIFIDSIKETIKEKGKAIIAIPGGRSVIGLFKLLKKEDLEWGKVHVFMIDERMVPSDDEQSNYKQAKELFLGKVNANVYAFDVNKGVDYYNKELDRITGNKRVFDVILLASGEDGHIAALYPEHHSIKKWGKEYFTMENSPKPPSRRVTASPDMIKGSGTIILLFSSKEKKEAYDKFVDKELSEEQCPAKIAKNSKQLYVLTYFE